MSVIKHICIRYGNGLVTILPDVIRIKTGVWSETNTSILTWAYIIRSNGTGVTFFNVTEIYSPYKQQTGERQ